MGCLHKPLKKALIQTLKINQLSVRKRRFAMFPATPPAHIIAYELGSFTFQEKSYLRRKVRK